MSNRIPTDDLHRTLVIANETLVSDVVPALVEHSGAEAGVLVVAPALTSRLAFWASDDREARRGAEERLAHCLACLGAKGIDAVGAIGDANPLLALEDALKIFPADEIVIVTHPEGRSNWLAHRIVERARERTDRPVHHVVADAAHGIELLAA